MPKLASLLVNLQIGRRQLLVGNLLGLAIIANQRARETALDTATRHSYEMRSKGKPSKKQPTSR